MIRHKTHNIDCIFQFEEDLEGCFDIAAYSGGDSESGIDVCVLASGLESEEEVDKSLVILIEDLLSCVRDVKARMRKRNRKENRLDRRMKEADRVCGQRKPTR